MWRTRNLKVLSAVSLAQDAASELLYPILPIFLTTTLGAPVALVGLIEGCAEAAAAGTKVIAGRLSDQGFRRRWIFAGYSLAAIGKFLVAAAVIWPIALLGRIVDRIGKGVRGAPRDALLVFDVDRADRGKAIGFHRAADTLGAVIGPLLGIWIIHVTHGDLRFALWMALIPAALSVSLIFLVKDFRQTSALKQPINKEKLPRELISLIRWITLFGLVNFPDALILLHLHHIGFSTMSVVGLYAAFNAVYALLAYPFGALTDRIAPRKLFAIGLFAFAVAYGGMGLTNSKTISLFLLLVYGVFAAINDAVGKSWVAKLAPDSAQGRAQGLFQGLSGGAVLISGIWAGLAWGSQGSLPLLISGVIALLVAVRIAR